MKKYVISAATALTFASPAIADENRSNVIPTYPPTLEAQGEYQFSEKPRGITGAVLFSLPLVMGPFDEEPKTPLSSGLRDMIKDEMLASGFNSISCGLMQMPNYSHINYPSGEYMPETILVCVDPETDRLIDFKSRPEIRPDSLGLGTK